MLGSSASLRRATSSALGQHGSPGRQKRAAAALEAGAARSQHAVVITTTRLATDMMV
jgi:hypothetical protein